MAKLLFVINEPRQSLRKVTSEVEIKIHEKFQKPLRVNLGLLGVYFFRYKFALIKFKLTLYKNAPLAFCEA